MPHFIIDCNQEIVEKLSSDTLLKTVYHAADTTGLFEKGDIKVRIRPYQYFMNGGQETDFIHVFGNILYGRSEAQKSALSKAIIQQLFQLTPETTIISMNIRDFDKASYCNKNMLL